MSVLKRNPAKLLNVRGVKRSLCEAAVHWATPTMWPFAMLAVALLCRGADPILAKTSEDEIVRQLLRSFPTNKQQFVNTLSNYLTQTGVTNFTAADLDQVYSNLSNMKVVHPSFGRRWDEVPAPTLTGTNAMDAVNAFIATNGWNMHTGEALIFMQAGSKEKPIKGLPWEAIKDRPFVALTHDNILYVELREFGGECGGIAYNPKTNRFPGTITGFKPIGNHWYVWKQTMRPDQDKESYYEGETPKRRQ